MQNARDKPVIDNFLGPDGKFYPPEYPSVDADTVVLNLNDRPSRVALEMLCTLKFDSGPRERGADYWVSLLTRLDQMNYAAIDAYIRRLAGKKGTER